MSNVKDPKDWKIFNFINKKKKRILYKIGQFRKLPNRFTPGKLFAKLVGGFSVLCILYFVFCMFYVEFCISLMKNKSKPIRKCPAKQKNKFLKKNI